LHRRTKIKNGVILTASLLLFLHCSDRERLNPLDPENPFTNGAPTGIRLYSQRDTVVLQWSPMQVNSLRRYYIYRAVDNAALALYDSVAGHVIEYIDDSLVFDKQYTYALQAKTEYDKSRLSQSLSVVPGPFDFIIADYYNQSLLRLTYDCNRLIEFYDGFTPTDLAVVQDRIYFTNLWDNSLKMIDTSGEVHSFEIGEAPVDLAYDSSSGLIYILGRDNNSLYTFSFDGEQQARTTLDTDIHFYSNISFDSVLHCLWITDDLHHKIFHYDLWNGELSSVAENIISPDEMVIDVKNGGGWIASAQGIIHIQSSGILDHLLSDMQIYDLSFDHRTGDVYYVAVSSNDNAWEIGRLSQNNRIPLFTNYKNIYKIQTISESNGTGLAIVNGYRAEVIRINARGEEIGMRRGLYGVMAMGLQ